MYHIYIMHKLIIVLNKTFIYICTCNTASIKKPFQKKNKRNK